MKEKLNKIRKPAQYSKKSNFIIFFISVVLTGFIMGVVSKYSDTVASNDGMYGAVLHSISYITTELGIWIFIASIIAMYSYKPMHAMMNSIGFFLSMLTSYYLYSRYVCGFYSTKVILYWVVIALLSSICAWIVWYGKGNGWLSDIFASLPIAVLFKLGYRYYDGVLDAQSITGLLDLLCAFILLILLSIGNARMKIIKVLAFAIIISLISNRIGIINIIYGV